MNTEFWQRNGQPVLSDSANLSINGVGVSKGVMCLAAGTLHVTLLGGNEDTITVDAAWVPFMYPCFVTRIWTTGTTIAASNLRVGA
jgi:hypothetical protein